MSKKERKARKKKSPRPSLTETSPAAMGRVFVLATRRSKRRSAISFMTHPALLIRKHPAVKIKTFKKDGFPELAIQSDQRVGINTRTVPIGRSTRMSLRHADSLFLKGSKKLPDGEKGGRKNLSDFSQKMILGGKPVFSGPEKRIFRNGKG